MTRRETSSQPPSSTTTQGRSDEGTDTLGTSQGHQRVSGKQPAPTTPVPRRTMESLLYSMFDNPSFIEELRWLVTKSHFELEYWSPLDTDDFVKDIIHFMREQVEIEARRKRR
jgi:hypothetical protein